MASSSWVTSATAAPRLASSARTSWVRSRLSASSPVAGSSRSSTPAPRAMPCASSARWRCPPERTLNGWSARSVSCIRSSASPTRLRRSSSPTRRRLSSISSERRVREIGHHRETCRSQVPIATTSRTVTGRASGALGRCTTSATSWERDTVPSDGLRTPASISISVDLPAPFSPATTVTSPRASATSTSSRTRDVP